MGALRAPRAAAAAAFFCFTAAATASAAVLPANFSESTFASGFSDPTAMAFAPDGRLFVAEQDGALRVVRHGATLPTPFLTVTVSSVGERGLLGVALDPDFESNGYVYVYYTATSPTIHNRVSRFTANGDVAIPGSERVLLDLEPLSATNHNGGAIHFGPDGMLYVAVGENAVPSNAQTLENRLGKMLRITATGAIPADNPFYEAASGPDRAIWALGLRNPFTFAFQDGTGRMFINDVGAGAWEEIDEGLAGANYGWPESEGPTGDPDFVSPLHAYAHASEPDVCAITGGAFYDSVLGTYPAAYDGEYFYADFCAGWIRRLDPTSGAVAGFASGIALPTNLESGPDGNLYYLARGSGTIHQVRHCSGAAPTLSELDPATGYVGSLAYASGNGFADGARLEFGVVPASAQPLEGGLVAEVPWLPFGTVSVRVVNPNGCRSNAMPFQVSAPTACGLLGLEPLAALGAVGAMARRKRRARCR